MSVVWFTAFRILLKCSTDRRLTESGLSIVAKASLTIVNIHKVVSMVHIKGLITSYNSTTNCSMCVGKYAHLKLENLNLHEGINCSHLVDHNLEHHPC